MSQWKNMVSAVESDDVDTFSRIHPSYNPGACYVINECSMKCSTSKTKILDFRKK
jgi:hypothetical protein